MTISLWLFYIYIYIHLSVLNCIDSCSISILTFTCYTCIDLHYTCNLYYIYIYMNCNITWYLFFIGNNTFPWKRSIIDLQYVFSTMVYVYRMSDWVILYPYTMSIDSGVHTEMCACYPWPNICIYIVVIYH